MRVLSIDPAIRNTGYAVIEGDARTLHVPDNVKLSPSQQAYWDIKRNYQDTVLFFKGACSQGAVHALGAHATIASSQLAALRNCTKRTRTLAPRSWAGS
jgi:hypothetical protein